MTILARSPGLKAPRTGATRTLTSIARIHSHTYHVVRGSASLAITEFGIEFFWLKVPEGGGEQTGVPGEKYRVHKLHQRRGPQQIDS